MTVGLSPGEVVPEVGGGGVEDHSAIECGRIQKGRVREIGGPVEHVGGSKKRGDGGHNLAAERYKHNHNFVQAYFNGLGTLSAA